MVGSILRMERIGRIAYNTVKPLLTVCELYKEPVDGAYLLIVFLQV